MVIIFFLFPEKPHTILHNDYSNLHSHPKLPKSLSCTFPLEPLNFLVVFSPIYDVTYGEKFSLIMVHFQSLTHAQLDDYSDDTLVLCVN